VTDDDGRFVLPELPEATYSVWVRGYGLTDSIPIEGRPGDRDIALQGLLMDGTVPSQKVAEQILKTMLETQKKYLPQFF